MKRTLALSAAALAVLTACGGQANDSASSAAPSPTVVTSTAKPSATPTPTPIPSAQETTSEAPTSEPTTEAPEPTTEAPTPSPVETSAAPAENFNPSISMTEIVATGDIAGQELRMYIQDPVIEGAGSDKAQEFSRYYSGERTKKLEEISKFYQQYYPADKEMFCKVDDSCLPTVKTSKSGSNVLGDYVSAYEYLDFAHPMGTGNTSVSAGVMNLKTGQALTFSDVFPNGFTSADVQPVGDYPAECLSNSNGDLALQHASFTIEADGVHVFWDKGTMGSIRACGAPEGLVPWGGVAVRPEGS